MQPDAALSLKDEVRAVVDGPMRRLMEAARDVWTVTETGVSGVADVPPETMNQFTFDAVVAIRQSLVLIAERIDQIDGTET